MTESKLTPTAVEALGFKCMYKEKELDGVLNPAARDEGEAPEGAVLVTGIVASYAFHPERITANRDRIMALLMQLPREFRSNEGGGWSFLNACVDLEGRQWGEHRQMELLMCMGIGAGIVETMPRELWPALPGGVPYFKILVGT